MCSIESSENSSFSPSPILPRTKVAPPVRTLRAMESAAPSPFMDIPEAAL